MLPIYFTGLPHKASQFSLVDQSPKGCTNPMWKSSFSSRLHHLPAGRNGRYAWQGDVPCAPIQSHAGSSAAMHLTYWGRSTARVKTSHDQWLHLFQCESSHCQACAWRSHAMGKDPQSLAVDDLSCWLSTRLSLHVKDWPLRWFLPVPSHSDHCIKSSHSLSESPSWAKTSIHPNMAPYGLDLVSARFLCRNRDHHRLD